MSMYSTRPLQAESELPHWKHQENQLGQIILYIIIYIRMCIYIYIIIFIYIKSVVVTVTVGIPQTEAFHHD